MSTELLEDLVDEAIHSSEASTESDATDVLLTDFIACVLGANVGDAPRGWIYDGTTGLAATLAVRAHAQDRDDLHWPTTVHAGSVVWPVALAVGSEVGATGSEVVAAARAGYHAMIGLARVLGAAHARSWHATATCGALGSVVPAAILLRLDAAERRWATGHALAMAGGVGQAVLERSGSTMFHRAAAAAIGIQAARLGQARIPSSRQVLEGERGVFALLAPMTDHSAPVRDTHDVLASMSVRLFPVNGFAQAAVALATQLRQHVGPEVNALVVEVPQVVADATTRSVGGDWWDLRSAIASAWTSGDPFLLDRSEESQRLRDHIRIVSRPGSCSMTTLSAHVAGNAVDAFLVAAPGTHLDDPNLAPLLTRKWDLLVGPVRGGALVARSVASAVVADGPRGAPLQALLAAGPAEGRQVTIER